MKKIAAVLLLVFVLFPLAINVWAQTQAVYEVEKINGLRTTLSGDVVGFSCVPSQIGSVYPDCYILLREK